MFQLFIKPYSGCNLKGALIYNLECLINTRGPFKLVSTWIYEAKTCRYYGILIIFHTIQAVLDYKIYIHSINY
jgi:hypothetical protein